MATRQRTVFGPRLVLTLLLTTYAGFVSAQDGTDDGLQPAVDTSAVEEIGPAVDTSAATGSEREELEPAATGAVLAADVTRQESGNVVMDRLELGRTEITGNQELPKVLYIVPWQKSDPGDLMGKPVNSLLDEILAPLDREEFIRQVDYYNDLYGNEGQE
jgi:hypothetical protein